MDGDCSYDEGYSDYTDSENNAEAASFLPLDLIYDPSEEEYDCDKSHHTTSSKLRAQRIYLQKHNPLEYQQSVFDGNPYWLKYLSSIIQTVLTFTPEVMLK